MRHMNIGTPTKEEFSEYHQTFISCVPDGKVEELLESQCLSFPTFVAGIPDRQADIIHAPYGWTIHQVIEHVVDAERVFGYRALRFATGDTTELPGWNENDYSASEYGRNVSIAELSQEFRTLRKSNIALLKRMDPDRFGNLGVADGRQFSVRAIVHLMVGHLIHHENILKSRLGM